MIKQMKCPGAPIVWDFIRYAQAGHPCRSGPRIRRRQPGRPASASPTSIRRLHLIFERFLSERVALPDIDIGSASGGAAWYRLHHAQNRPRNVAQSSRSAR